MAGINQFLQIVVKAHADSTAEPRTKSVINVYNFRRTVLGGAPSKSNAATAFKTAVLTPLQACLSVSYITDYLDVRWLDDALDPFLESALALSGTVTGDSLPSLNNVTLHQDSGFRGKSNRGLKHYGPIAESHTTLDHLTSAALTLWGTFITAYLAGFTSSDPYTYVPFIVSQKNSAFTALPPIIVGVDVTAMSVNTVLGQMKRRKEPAHV